MNELLSQGLWQRISDLAGTATRKRAAIAYVTSEEPLTFGEHDELITDASDEAITSGSTNAEVLVRAVGRGAAVYSIEGLHAKVLLIDRVAVVGSANLSNASANSLIEAAWIGSNPALVAGVQSFIQELRGRARPVDQRFLDHITGLEVRRRSNGPRRTSQHQIPIRAAHCWLLGLHPMTKQFLEEQAEIERGEALARERVRTEESNVDWIHWTGNSAFRRQADRGDSVIQIWRERRSGPVVRVYRHAPILERQEGRGCTRFFVEGFPDEIETAITWTRFRRLLTQVGINGVRNNPCREITNEQSEALYQLWET
jgi:hypothetical protein